LRFESVDCEILLAVTARTPVFVFQERASYAGWTR